MQQYPLLQPKLYCPPIRPELVSRPRLDALLNAEMPAPRGSPHALTLISAPAGFGKTTLVAEWAFKPSEAKAADRIAWLLLDEADNDPARFLVYVVAALKTIEADNGEAELPT